ncbi:MAG TPA: AI-2E family transporter [Caulifigura sp.]|jgi:predicted PurR-regulated permease PerM|nr:AI-2E family transporter [Caulifigura sp.]
MTADQDTPLAAGSDPEPPVPAEAVSTGLLIIVSALVAYLCYLVAQPFLTALAWALALAVVAHPVHRWLHGRIKSPTACAATTVVGVGLLLLAPVGFVTHSLVREATNYIGVVQEGITSGRWEKALESNRYVGPIVKRMTELSEQPDQQPKTDESPGTPPDDSNPQPEEKPSEAPEKQESASPPPLNGTPRSPAPAPGFNRPSGGSIASAAGMVTSQLSSLLGTIVGIGMQLFITMMCLFFFLRDRPAVMKGVRGLLPLSRPEADRILQRIDDTIHATIFGSLTVAFVQGCMGGLMFWILGLPSPLFWGAIMGLLAVVPVLGTFVIWAPTAAWLAIQGDWGKAIILVTWGSLAIGLIDNFLYPYLVGNRMRFHTLLVFFSIVGGLSVFGAAGIILGPVLLAVADGLLQVWRHRMARAQLET